MVFRMESWRCRILPCRHGEINHPKGKVCASADSRKLIRQKEVCCTSNRTNAASCLVYEIVAQKYKPGGIYEAARRGNRLSLKFNRPSGFLNHRIPGLETAVWTWVGCWFLVMYTHWNVAWIMSEKWNVTMGSYATNRMPLSGWDRACRRKSWAGRNIFRLPFWGRCCWVCWWIACFDKPAQTVLVLLLFSIDGTLACNVYLNHAHRHIMQ